MIFLRSTGKCFVRSTFNSPAQFKDTKTNAHEKDLGKLNENLFYTLYSSGKENGEISAH